MSRHIPPIKSQGIKTKLVEWIAIKVKSIQNNNILVKLKNTNLSHL